MSDPSDSTYSEFDGGMYSVHDNLRVAILEKLGNTPQDYLDWTDDQCETRFIKAVCSTTGISAREFYNLPQEERLLYLLRTHEEYKPDDTSWPNQADVAKRFEVSRTTIARWIESGKLRTNGKTGHDCRIDPASFAALERDAERDL